MGSVSLITAFLAGVASFVSPCVLPLVPAYISFMSGITADEFRGDVRRPDRNRRVAVSSLLFILGFTTVFVILGASATLLGRFLVAKIGILSKVAGVLIVILGLHMMGVFRIGFLNYEKRFQTGGRQVKLLSSFLAGIAFAFGWTPCIGPILAAILAYAGTRETVGQGVLLLVVYSLGLAVPFFLTGMFTSAFFSVSGRLKRHFHAIEVASGVLLIAVGVLIFTNSFGMLSGYISQWFPWLNVG
jgi:cytochrome c-type biogenesis protein